LARDTKTLTDLRRRLRETMIKSPLTDASQCARDIEEAYLEMWDG
jgi:predicted O-linked N-acetylglucosamine transferase (SPINDLY family)